MFQEEFIPTKISDRFKGHKNAESYILKTFKPWWELFGWLNLYELDCLKENLKLCHDANQLRTIKASINSQCERYKNFTPIGVWITIGFSSFLATIASLLISFLNVSTNVLLTYKKTRLDNGRSLDMNSIMEDLSKIVLSNYEGYFKVFFTVILFLGVAIVWYYFKLNRLLKLNSIVEQALEEKSKEKST
jgi:hypothetical protein